MRWMMMALIVAACAPTSPAFNDAKRQLLNVDGKDWLMQRTGNYVRAEEVDLPFIQLGGPAEKRATTAIEKFTKCSVIPDTIVGTEAGFEAHVRC